MEKKIFKREIVRRCKDCQSPLPDSRPDHEHCLRCLALWYEERGIPDDACNADFDEPFPQGEY